jgi:demethylmenaquinone methyltransferase/2-methoxy-6-polyprenyl-1,4-benzoquinol methylase
MTRVTRPGGRVACLEIAPPSNALLEPFFRIYFFRIVPLIGGLVSGDGKAYSYLPHSTVEFPPPEELARLMEQAGLSNVVYNEYMIKTVAIHAGTKLKSRLK